MSDKQSGPGLRIINFKLTDDPIMKGRIHILIGLHRLLCNVCNFRGNTLFLDLDVDPYVQRKTQGLRPKWGQRSPLERSDYEVRPGRVY